MKLTDSQKDILEDLLKHNGFDVVEQIAESERARLIQRLTQTSVDFEETQRIRGELKGLEHATRKSLESLIRDTP